MVGILIIDDTVFMRTILSTLVTEGGHEVVAEAEDGYLGISEFINTKPDLVLLDILMPKMDGIMTLKSLMSYDPEALVIMVSAINSTKMIKLAFSCGAKGYVMKPFQKHQLLAEIAKATAGIVPKVRPDPHTDQ
ncbi:MAG TPA: response regulator [Methanospirillum sp.]|nr:response regulator [Methanospirillum sp.]